MGRLFGGTRAHMCVFRGQMSTSSGFSNTCSPSYWFFLRRSLSLNLLITESLDWLASKNTLPPPPQH